MLPHIQRKKNNKRQQKRQKKEERKELRKEEKEKEGRALLYSILEETAFRRRKTERLKIKQRLQHLDTKFGLDKGSTNERARCKERLLQLQEEEA